MAEISNKILKPCEFLVNKFLLLLDFLFAYLEMHLVKLMAFSLMALCCSMVNALHLSIVFILLLSVIFGSSTMAAFFLFIGPFLSIAFLSKMFYQTKFVPEYVRTLICSNINVTLHSTLQNTVLDLEWWGFHVLQEGENLASYYKGYLFVFLVLTFQAVIKTRQKIMRIDLGLNAATPHIMYPGTTRKEADTNLKGCLKFLINYGYYKFGVEISLSFCVFAIVYRMDVFSILYAVWVAVLSLLDRLTLSMVWPFFFTTMIFSILWQYAMAVGLSPKSCFQYPWADQTLLIKWIFLPSFNYPPDTSKTLVDFVLLLLIQRQQSVFELERKFGDRYLGGSNKDIYMQREIGNPTPDHMGSIKSWLDVGKFIFLRCLFRITLAFVFWNGASNANLFSLGYLVGAFVFLWIDCDLCMWDIKRILKWWNTLLGFTVFVVLAKAILEFVCCLYCTYFFQNSFWLIKFPFVRCEKLEEEYSQISPTYYWDVVCFTCIIFQRRYFKSYYFLHEVDDVLAVHRLQAKGARLVDELHENKLNEFHVRERRTLMKIKKNMNRIKAWQRRLYGLNYNEPTDHATAICMGDYIMFEHVENISTKKQEYSDLSSSSDEDESSKKTERGKNLTELIGTVFKRVGEESLVKLQKKSDASEAGKRGKFDSQVKKEDSESPKKERSEEEEPESKDEETVEEELEEDTEDKDKMKKTWKLLLTLLNDVMISMINFFNKHSEDYIYIESRMRAERKAQKKLRRETVREVKRPSKDIQTKSKTKDDPKFTFDEEKRFSIKSQESRDDIENIDLHKKSFQTLVVDLINSLCMFVMSQTELLCYIIIFLHAILAPTLITLPLPLFVFMWGSLTTVRPTTTFWTVMIAYTEVTVVIKALFQNSFFPWNGNSEEWTILPENPPMFIGIHRHNQYVLADLFLLLLLFLHRYKLKTLGLWNRTHEEETLLPQNLKLYKELPSENDLKQIKRNRSIFQQKRRVPSESVGLTKDSALRLVQMATWKCTSRVTASLAFWENKIRTRIRVKEIEGSILVTHEGRRLQPTLMYVTQPAEDQIGGNIVLRVYSNDIVADTKGLFYKLSWVQHVTSLRKFFIQIIDRDWRISADFYTLMFVFEFLDFLIVFFGFSLFTEFFITSIPVWPVIHHQFWPSLIPTAFSDRLSFAGDQVPFMYLFTVITHFLVIIIDRILYLRKDVLGKMVFQFILLILVHSWMFVIIPIVTDRPFNTLHVPQTYYIISCFYFLMSAYQLRGGYPMRVQGHFLCKKYGYLNYYAFKGLQFIPFFNQLRTILDFLCTKSSMTMTEWIKMESIFQLIYENKCIRRADIYYPVPRGEECPKCSKYLPGVSVLSGMIVVIWLPFILFALFNTIAQSNLPQEASLTIRIGNFGNIYMTEATFTEILQLTPAQYRGIQALYKDNRKVLSFLALYDWSDVAVLKFRFQPYKPWLITTQEMSTLTETVLDLENPIHLYLVWNMVRIPRSQIVFRAVGHSSFFLDRNNIARHEFVDAFLNKKTEVHLNRMLPKFLHVTNEGDAIPMTGIMGPQATFRNISLSLQGESEVRWWKMTELPDKQADAEFINKLPYHSSREITIYTFNDKNLPEVLLNFSKKGIIGLYLSVVFVMWTLVKRAMWRYPYLMFSEMPNPDPLLKLCNDIYLARESHEFALEEDLFAKLLFLFRSPETLIKVTKLTNTNQT